jgi:diacylglycerol kinase (ATP)
MTTAPDRPGGQPSETPRVSAGGRVVVCVNATALRSARRRWEPAVSLLASRYAVEVVTPTSVQAMDDGVRRLADDGAAGLVVVGGDGTISRVVHALGGAKVPVGLLPVGTGNDFARALGIPGTPSSAARSLLAGRTRDIDLLEVNGRLFCTAGVLGVPADATMTVRRWLSPGRPTRPLLHLLGGLAYTLAGARHLLRPRALAEAWVIDGRPWRTAGIFLANTPVIGGGLRLPMESDPADGLMEVAVIRDVPRLRLLGAFVRFARGWRVPPDILHIERVPAVRVTCGAARPFSADGDLMSAGSEFAVTVRPRALRVWAA